MPLFLFTAAALLLQIIPFTGVFLMLVAAPFWSVLTLNLAFAALAIEALVGLTDRRWLLAPILYFGGYAVFAHQSNEHYLKLDAQLRAENARQSIAFDAERQVLVFDERNTSLSGAAGSFVRRYALPVTYDKNVNFEPAGHISYRLALSQSCQRLRNERGNLPSGISVSGFHEQTAGKRKLVKDLCTVHVPEDPARPTIEISSVRENQNSWLLPHTLDTTIVSDGIGGMATLVTGQAQVLGWLPKPVMGCALNSGAPSWDCFYGFYRSTVGLGGEGTYGAAARGAIADLLKLKQADITAVSAAAARQQDTVERAIEAALRGRLDHALANLDDAIEGTDRRIIIHDVSGLIGTPDATLSRGQAMGAAIARDVTGPQARFETARVMQAILAFFPKAEFDAIARPMLPVLLEPVRRQDWVVASDFATRLGDLGAEALPILEALAFGQKRAPFADVVFGFCRAGPLAAGYGERLLALAPSGTAARRKSDLNTAIYVTLKRIGRGDLVAADAAQTSPRRFQVVRAEVAEREIGPESPRSACYGRSAHRPLPD